MRKHKRLVVGAILVVGLVAVSAVAQPPRQGGGFGMMGGGGPLALLNSKTVKEEIKLTSEQETKFKDWLKEYGPRSMEMMKEKFSGIAKEDFREKMPAIMAEIQKTVYKEIGTILDEGQVKRLKQIDVQVMGLRAFSNAEVVEALKLSDEQKDKLKDATQTMGKEMAELREEYGIKGFGIRPMDEAKAKEYDKKVSAITKETMDKVMAMMSDSQKATWKDLTGAPVDVQKISTETRPNFGGPGGFQPKKKKKIDDESNS